jgi:hypothetical protein
MGNWTSGNSPVLLTHTKLSKTILMGDRMFKGLLMLLTLAKPNDYGKEDVRGTADTL